MSGSLAIGIGRFGGDGIRSTGQDMERLPIFLKEMTMNDLVVSATGYVSIREKGGAG